MTERERAAKVVVAVGVTAWATQRAFARDLDGKHGTQAAEYLAPRFQNMANHVVPAYADTGHLDFVFTMFWDRERALREIRTLRGKWRGLPRLGGTTLVVVLDN